MAEEYGRLPEEEVLGQIPGLMDGALKEGEIVRLDMPPYEEEVLRVLSRITDPETRQDVEHLYLPDARRMFEKVGRCHIAAAIEDLYSLGGGGTDILLRAIKGKDTETRHRSLQELSNLDAIIIEEFTNRLSKCGCQDKDTGIPE